jgi:hypothetical protein
MPLEESLKRPFTTYPHVGRTLIAGDFVTITDLWHSGDAYLHVLQSGSTWANDCGWAWNSGSNGTTTHDYYMKHEPTVGMSDRFRFITQGFVSFYDAVFGGEINSQHDSFALALDFRFLSEAEMTTLATNSSGSGIGARGQRLRVYLKETSNPASVPILSICDIFADYYWYAANVSPAIPALPAVNAPNPNGVYNLANGTTTMTNSGINQVLFVDKLAAALRKVGSGAAQLQIIYELPRQGNGSPWNPATTAVDYATMAAIPNPMTGIDETAWGALAVTFTTFRSTTYTAPTLAIGANGRAQSVYPTTLEPQIGDNLGTQIFGKLLEKGNSSKSVSWPSVFQGIRSFGGIPRIVAGNVTQLNAGSVFNLVDTATETLVMNVQIPNGATRFAAYTQIRLTAGTGGHVVTADLEREFATSPFIATQNLLTRTYAGNPATQWVWVDLPLDANMQPNSGQIERVKLTLKSRKPTPRVGSNPTPAGFWDGIGSFYLAFR